MRAVRLLISGRVQGVGYRDWAQREAVSLGLAGWVRNLRDGRVEAVAAGTAAAVAAFVERAKQGPWSARVDSVEVSVAEAPAGADFDVFPTA
ncbi:MAG TPA: acylphosphatase [Sphingomonas sp.]|jgi:acylphosphatase|nr:acylphosphatase [Sphingomonas sp.]